ncbi:unnamed protein product [Miscanthus lutarioriparius]|uniref:Uncharacterized protein n=1 Tax=Miscanthus lutarioriparius TaxID=422564 RepID=A0A811Q7W8_9POAL|nr:unnamed protein product [Miscanthus lutarioriparius]
MEDEDEEVLVVTTMCLSVADDDALLNQAGESIQHGVVASTLTRAVAAATESADTPENTAAEADATAAAVSVGKSAGRGRSGLGGHEAHRGDDPREVPRGPAQRARSRREAEEVIQEVLRE